MTFLLGSRGSALARWQADYVRSRLEAVHPGLRVEVRIVRTTGDRITDVPLARIGDKGLFTKEVDQVVLSGEVHAAVHSFKDVPTRLPDGLTVAAVLEREDPRDAFVTAPGRASTLEALPPGATVGTSSLRRRAQLLRLRPDIVVEDLRGNLDSRLERVKAGDRYDAAILALAGLRRLGRQAEVARILEPPAWLPAVGQGALAVVARDDDATTRAYLAALDHPATRAATAAERAFLHALEGGCQIPIGALATARGERLRLHGFVAALAGTPFLEADAEGPASAPDDLGRALAAELRARGADDVLRDVRAQADSILPHASAP
ncbi:MAG TPA: hydroxymethylbilane synthase [Longimicrobiales bacterium]